MSLDQPLALTQTEVRMIDKVDQVVNTAIENKDDSSIVGLSKILQRTGHACALAQAKLLYLWHKAAASFDVEKDDWADYVSSELGLSLQTIRKYVSVWQWVFDNEDVPISIRPRLMNIPMQTLLLVAPAAAESQLTNEHWMEIANAPDRGTVHDLVRKVRGQVSSSKNAMVIMLKRDGTLTARKLDDYIPFGFLNPEVTDPVAVQAVERIIRTAGIVRQ